MLDPRWGPEPSYSATASAHDYFRIRLRTKAIAELDGILESCQAVMVARGDLGLEMPLERVPRAQKEITRRARVAAQETMARVRDAVKITYR